MTIDQLQQALDGRVNGPALATLRGSITLHCLPTSLNSCDHHPDAILQFRSDGNRLVWLNSPEATDATFYFDSCEHALALLSGEADVMAEFMAGRFRSSGYLLWTFPLLSLFRN